MSSKPEKHKKLWSRFKITIGDGYLPNDVSKMMITAYGWCKNSGGIYGNFGSYNHISGIDLTKVAYTQSEQQMFKLGDGSFFLR